MRPGDTYVGPDGTAYLVVRISTVREDQFRWWIDARSRYMAVDDYQDGPASPTDLHLVPAREIGGVGLGLVLP